MESSHSALQAFAQRGGGDETHRQQILPTPQQQGHKPTPWHSHRHGGHASRMVGLDVSSDFAGEGNHRSGGNKLARPSPPGTTSTL